MIEIMEDGIINVPKVFEISPYIYRIIMDVRK